MKIKDDLKVHSYVLEEHILEIAKLRKTSHDINTLTQMMGGSIEIMNKNITDIIKNQSELNQAMREFTTVKNILMGRFFWVVLGMVTIIFLDHIPFLQSLIKG